MITSEHNLAAGAMAGVIGGFALAGAAQSMYALTSPQDIQREKKIEPNDPFIVLAKKVQAATGVNMNQRQEKRFEQVMVTSISAVAGMTYSLVARRWPLGWLTGGLVFGTLFWAVEDEGISPVMGLVGDNTKYPVEAHLRGLVAHAVFGVVTAGLVEAFTRR